MRDSLLAILATFALTVRIPLLATTGVPHAATIHSAPVAQPGGECKGAGGALRNLTGGAIGARRTIFIPGSSRAGGCRGVQVHHLGGAVVGASGTVLN